MSRISEILDDFGSKVEKGVMNGGQFNPEELGEQAEAAINAYIAENYIKLSAVTPEIQAVLANIQLGNKVYTQAEVAEVIGEDEPVDEQALLESTYDDVPVQDYVNQGRNQLRAEQRKRAGL